MLRRFPEHPLHPPIDDLPLTFTSARFDDLALPQTKPSMLDRETALSAILPSPKGVVPFDKFISAGRLDCHLSPAAAAPPSIKAAAAPRICRKIHYRVKLTREAIFPRDVASRSRQAHPLHARREREGERRPPRTIEKCRGDRANPARVLRLLISKDDRGFLGSIFLRWPRGRAPPPISIRSCGSMAPRSRAALIRLAGPLRGPAPRLEHPNR